MFEPGHPIERGLWLCHVLLVALAPWLLGANRDWIWAWLAGAGLALAALTAASCRLDSRRHEELLRRGRPLFWIAIGILIVQGLGILLAGPLGFADVRASARSLLWQCAVTAVAIGLVLLTHSRRRLRWVLMIWFANAAAIAMTGITMSLAGIDVALFGIPLDSGPVARVPFINRNHFAGYLAVAGAIGFGLLCADLSRDGRAESWRERLSRWLSLLLSRKLLVRTLLVVVVVGLVVSQSRMGNLAFALAIALGGVVAVLFWKPRPPALVPLVLSIFVIDVILAGSWFGLDRLQERFRDTTVIASVEQAATEVVPGAAIPAAPSGGTEPSDGERARVALSSLQMLPGHWLLGIGPGGWRAAFPEFKPDTVHLHYQHAHNDWVQMLVERGIIGFGLWLALLVLAARLCLRALRHREDRLLRGAAVGILTALTAMGIHALADFNLQIPAYWLFVHVLLALSVNVVALPERNVSTRP